MGMKKVVKKAKKLIKKAAKNKTAREIIKKEKELAGEIIEKAVKKIKGGSRKKR